MVAAHPHRIPVATSNSTPSQTFSYGPFFLALIFFAPPIFSAQFWPADGRARQQPLVKREAAA